MHGFPVTEHEARSGRGGGCRSRPHQGATWSNLGMRVGVSGVATLVSVFLFFIPAPRTRHETRAALSPLSPAAAAKRHTRAVGNAPTPPSPPPPPPRAARPTAPPFHPPRLPLTPSAAPPAALAFCSAAFHANAGPLTGAGVRIRPPRSVSGRGERKPLTPPLAPPQPPPQPPPPAARPAALPKPSAPSAIAVNGGRGGAPARSVLLPAVPGSPPPPASLAEFKESPSPPRHVGRMRCCDARPPHH